MNRLAILLIGYNGICKLIMWLVLLTIVAGIMLVAFPLMLVLFPDEAEQFAVSLDKQT